jgi:nicotinamidase-related amidase
MKAILIIDIQSGLTTRKTLHNELNFIETVNSALEKIRNTENVVIFVQHNNKQLIKGGKDWEIDCRLARNREDITLQKQHGNAFKETDLKLILDSKNVKEIIVCGLVSHGCVKSTCIGGLNNGFITNLLKNGHTNWNKDAEIKISETELDLEKNGVKLIDVNEI